MSALIAFARPDAATAPALHEEEDWTPLIDLALQHGLSPLLARRALALAAGAVPDALRAAFEHHREDNDARNRDLAHILFRLLDALSGQGIDALPFKGQTLGVIAFGDYRHRRAGDVDLLLRLRDREAACVVLEALGYRELTERELGRAMTPVEWAVCRRYQCEYAYYSERDRTLVEPHWAFAPRTLAAESDYERMWLRAETVEIEGRVVPTLARTDLLAALCIHGSKHEWVRLQWIADVAALLHRHPDLDLDGILRDARTRGLERMVLLGIGLARDVLGVTLPAAASRQVDADAEARALMDVVKTRLATAAPVESSVFRPSRFRWRMRERWRDRLNYFVRTIATPREIHVQLVPWLRLPPVGYVPVKLVHDYVALPLWRRFGGRDASG